MSDDIDDDLMQAHFRGLGNLAKMKFLHWAARHVGVKVEIVIPDFLKRTPESKKP